MNPIKIISASAGSGKTFRLTEILEQFVCTHQVRPEAVLATTFTNKAAAELQERVRVRLLAAGKVSEAHRITAARIGTVNAICGRLVSEFAFELGLSPKLQVLDEDLASQALRRALADKLTFEEERELHALVERMPDFKWQEVVQRIVDLARSNGIAPASLSTCASRSIKEYATLLGTPLQDGSAVDDQLRTELSKFIAVLARGSDQTKTTNDAREKAENAHRRLKLGMTLPWKEWVSLTKLKCGKSSEAAAEPVRLAASQQDRHPRLLQDVSRAITLAFELAARTMDAYQAYKRELGVLDFVDQEKLALHLLRQEHVRLQLKEQLDLVLVDEFQDTSPLQLAIFLQLAEISPQNVWVGDQKQAIFGFRGTDPALMDAAIDTILEGHAPETLTKSYRSRPELVDLTSSLFSPAFAQMNIPEERVRLTAGLQNLPEGLGEIIETWNLETKNQPGDAEALAQGIQALLADHVLIRDRKSGVAREIRGSDIAVLCRTNDMCANVAQALALRGIHASLPRTGLLATLEARCVLAGLRLWVDERDTLATAELARLVEYAGREEDWFGSLLRQPEAFEKLPQRLAILQARDHDPMAGALAALDAVIEVLRMRRLCRRWGDADQRLANLEALRGHAASYVNACIAQGAGCTPAGLIAHLCAIAEAGTDNQGLRTDADAVIVSTWHSAKGLEWPVTVLFELSLRQRDTVALGVHAMSDEEKPSLADPLRDRWIRYWPNPYDPKNNKMPFHNRLSVHPATIQAQKRVEREELRLLYVGWTRASDRLVLVARTGQLTAGILGLLRSGETVLIHEPEADVITWAQREVSVKRRSITPISVEAPPPTPAFEYQEAGPRDYPPAFVQPSASQSAAAPAQNCEQIHSRLPVTGNPDWSALGSAVHGFLCADRQNLSLEYRMDIARRQLRLWHVSSAIDPGDLLSASDSLRRWVETRWPKASWRREWPIYQRLENGSVIKGSSDLVLESPDGHIVIDHKSYPGSVTEALKRAGTHAEQVRLYANAIVAATGKPTMGCFIHMPLLGLMIPLENGPV